MALELYGARGCPYTAELRADLEWQSRAFVEYDVEADDAARDRLCALVDGSVRVPVLVEDGAVVQIGLNGRACYIAASPR